MATYFVYYTTAASRSFSEFEPRLIASHRQFDPSLHSSAIKIITHYLHRSEVNRLITGDGRDASSARWIRIVIEIPRGRHTDEAKQQLLQRTTQACLDYQGKHASQCEIEVRIEEFEEGNVLRTNVGIRG